MGVLKLMIIAFVIITKSWNSYRDFVFCSKTLQDDGFTDDQVDNIVNVVNKFRSEVKPTAANLHRVGYSMERSWEAKTFTDKCQIPQREEPKMFIETWYFSWTSLTPDNNSSPLFQFRTKYNNENDSCDPSAKDCDFSKNLLSDQLFLMGCSRNSACQKNFTEITVCVMEYRNNLKPLYVSGPPCSRCYREKGSMCYEGLCVDKTTCADKKWNCTCQTKCVNCGILNPDTCECECRYGNDQIDCSATCKDDDKDCGNIVAHGYYWENESILYNIKKGKEGCQQNFKIEGRLCRRTCGKCRDATEPVPDQPLTQRCCTDLKCDEGYKKDEGKCQCLKKIPDNLLKGLSQEQTHNMLAEINKWRSERTDPPATNLHWLEYGIIEATQAETFTKKCEVTSRNDSFAYGYYNNTEFGYTYFYSWQTEEPDLSPNPMKQFDTSFNFKGRTCNTYAKMCPLYATAVSDTVFHLGCSRNSTCVNKDFKEITVCGFGFGRRYPYYLEGTPCSKCWDKRGTFCYQNLCISEEKCRNEKLNCACNLKCKNCGVLDPAKCQCICKYGYDQIDCSEKCANKFDNCDTTQVAYKYQLVNQSVEVTPVTGKEACGVNEVFWGYDCRKLCGKCQEPKPYDPRDWRSGPCCEGTTCKENERRDKKNCSCIRIRDDGFDDEQKLNLELEVNRLRSSVIPTAANLHRVEYSSSRAYEARNFTNKCQIPERIEPNTFGETWLFSWTSEDNDDDPNPLKRFDTKFNYSTETCDADAKDCEFFKNLISDHLFWFGCNRNRKCQNETFVEMTVCSLEYGNSLKPVYLSGPPCSRCVRKDNYFCLNNLCTSKSYCDKGKHNCTCETKCKNCGTLDLNTCACSCLYGFNHIDCSEACADAFPNCTKLTAHGYKKDQGMDSRMSYFNKVGKGGCSYNMKFSHQQCRKLCGNCEISKPYNASDPRTEKCCPDVRCPNSSSLNDLCQCENEFGFTDVEWKGLLNAPNKWKSEVQPTATNMHRLDLSNKLAKEAKTLTENCDPPPLNDPSSHYFQITTNYSDNSTDPLSRFYKKYNYSSDTCANSTKEQCELFKAFIADTSREIGCSRNSYCENKGKNFSEITICVLRPRNDLEPLYVPGKPCTKCVKEHGSFCHKNLCITKEKCRKENVTCTCERSCKKCSTPNDENCTCQCLYGSYALQCDEPCKDRTNDCRNLSGYGFDASGAPLTKKGKEACQIDDKFAMMKCPKFCAKCQVALPKYDPYQPLSRQCCPDLYCPEKNQIPDINNCECVVHDAVDKDEPDFNLNNYPPDGYCPGKSKCAKYLAFSPIFLFVFTIIFILTYFVSF